MLWRQPQNHDTDCYFCLCDISRINSKKIKLWPYPNVNSVIFPISRFDNEIISENALSEENLNDSEGSHNSEEEVDADKQHK